MLIVFRSPKTDLVCLVNYEHVHNQQLFKFLSLCEKYVCGPEVAFQNTIFFTRLHCKQVENIIADLGNRGSTTSFTLM